MEDNRVQKEKLLLQHAKSRLERFKTTTASRLFHLPTGGRLIDSPGIREFSLSHLRPEQLLSGFVDFHPHLGHCKFRDCSHRHEPQCALLAAVAQKQLSAERLENYHQIVDSQET